MFCLGHKTYSQEQGMQIRKIKGCVHAGRAVYDTTAHGNPNPETKALGRAIPCAVYISAVAS